MTVKYNVNYNKPFVMERYRKDNNYNYTKLNYYQ